MSLLNFLNIYWFQILLTIIINYLIGSISFSIIITKKITDGIDIRTLGSGNAGFTNVLRAIGKFPAMLTFVGDFSKGILAVLIGKLIFGIIPSNFAITPQIVQYGAYIAGIACVLGHVYPCFFAFKGGKGVLTTAALILMFDWRVFLICMSIFIIVFVYSKIISLSSITAAALCPVAMFLVGLSRYTSNKSMPFSYIIVSAVVVLLLAALIIYKHKPNIKRILNGTEAKITMK